MYDMQLIRMACEAPCHRSLYAQALPAIRMDDTVPALESSAKDLRARYALTPRITRRVEEKELTTVKSSI
jgi:hypothetical protein